MFLMVGRYLRGVGGEEIETKERHSITAFGKLAQVVEKNLDKGSRVLIHGRLHNAGGLLQENGERTPRQVYIHAEMITPLATRRE